MERLSIYFSRNYANVDVQEEGGVTRNVAGKKMEAVLENLGQDDRELLAAFCKGILECLGGDCKRLTNW